MHIKTVPKLQLLGAQPSNYIRRNTHRPSSAPQKTPGEDPGGRGDDEAHEGKVHADHEDHEFEDGEEAAGIGQAPCQSCDAEEEGQEDGEGGIISAVMALRFYPLVSIYKIRGPYVSAD